MASNNPLNWLPNHFIFIPTGGGLALLAGIGIFLPSDNAVIREFWAPAIIVYTAGTGLIAFGHWISNGRWRAKNPGGKVLGPDGSKAPPISQPPCRAYWPVVVHVAWFILVVLAVLFAIACAGHMDRSL